MCSELKFKISIEVIDTNILKLFNLIQPGSEPPLSTYKVGKWAC